MIQFTFTAKSKLFLSFLLLPLILALAQLDISTDLEGSGPSCGANYIMNGSALETNLQVVLSSLVENVTKTGYNISSYGENGDKIYGLAQCRGDLNAPTCRECASAAQDHLNESCGGFSSGSVQLKGCFMRYDTRNFYSQLSSTNSTVQCVNPTRGLDRSISNLLKTIVEKAASSDVRYSTGNENGIYSLAQCWRDLNTSQCSQCLDTVYKGLLECLQGQGFTENCMIRYEADKFYADAVSSPSPPGGSGPPLPPSGETGKGRPNLLLSIGLTIVGVVIVLLLGLLLIWKRKVIQHFYKKRLPGHSKLSIELSTALSKSKLNYKYSTLRAATKNFNPANKIGEGGFGSVYKGVLPNGNEIAVKRLFTDKEQSVSDFFNEVTLIAHTDFWSTNTFRTRAWIYSYLVWNNHLSSTVLNVIDPNIKKNCKEEVLHVVHVALLCTQASARLRPSMSKVMMFLTNKDLNLPATTEPPFVDVDYSQSSVHTGVASASTSETRNAVSNIASSSAAPISSVHTSVASASTSETRNPVSNIASSSAAPISSNTISTSSFGPR